VEIIFVYGTLRMGYHNHRLIVDCEFIDVARTVNNYAMYANGIPYVSENEQVSQIYGELYLVKPKILFNLDMLEGHPSWYKRKKVPIETLSGKIYNAWLYFNETKTDNLITSGDFTEHRS
tara:strand:- start:2045 stop:2404 length:360 start_codon:yes stop_codon:yes gene_type:complete